MIYFDKYHYVSTERDAKIHDILLNDVACSEIATRNN